MQNVCCTHPPLNIDPACMLGMVVKAVGVTALALAWREVAPMNMTPPFPPPPGRRSVYGNLLRERLSAPLSLGIVVGVVTA